MQRRDQTSLLDIIEQIRVIREHMIGISYEEFLGDVLRQDALVRRIEVIGEAATRLSSAFRDAHSEVEWRDIREMRNFLIHVYDKIDYEKVWDTVQHDLTPLLNSVERILAEDASSSASEEKHDAINSD